MDTFDVGVIGCGGIGSAALYHLAKRGLKVVGLEQFSIAHNRGSSHGKTRLIRQAYFEHSAYVPLLLRSYQLWRELEQLTQQRLFDQLGLIEIGRPHGELLAGIRKAASEHSLQIESLTAQESRRRFPMFRIPEGMEAIFEPTAGLLFVESCVEAHIRAAKSHHAEVHPDTKIQRIELDRSPLEVHTDDRVIRADRLVVCAGAWSNPVMQLQLPLRVVRKHLHWFPTQRACWHAKEKCPTFFYAMADGYFYGFPALDASGVKVAEHSGGEPVSDPTHLDRTPDVDDERRVLSFLHDQLVDVNPSRSRHCVCMYTRTPDDHFIVDRHPENANIAFAAGLSGHGFKFAPVLGEVLADLVTQGTTAQPIDFLALDREELRIEGG